MRICFQTLSCTLLHVLLPLIVETQGTLLPPFDGTEANSDHTQSSEVFRQSIAVCLQIYIYSLEYEQVQYDETTTSEIVCIPVIRL